MNKELDPNAVVPRQQEKEKEEAIDRQHTK